MRVFVLFSFWLSFIRKYLNLRKKVKIETIATLQIVDGMDNFLISDDNPIETEINFSKIKILRD